ncbi:Bestrophin, RFP-TM, chloride channel-domain-containing protein [Pavlovales sp. CCMP2436]|nr:Bestrophin, RFP-TM, chloride channel-domain-containing protein [Pavlovales sp. CCMP2436]
MGEAGVLAWWEQAHLLSHFDGLLESAVGAHKVASTPVPFPYTQLLSWLVNVFVCTVPLAVASAYAGGGPPEEALSPLTIGLVSFASAVIALALLGINETAAELEAPFGYDPNDIKLGKLGEAMEIDVAVLLRGTSFAQALIAQRSAAAAKIAAPKKK